MSLIEKAVERLEKLKKAAGESDSSTSPASTDNPSSASSVQADDETKASGMSAGHLASALGVSAEVKVTSDVPKSESSVLAKVVTEKVASGGNEPPNAPPKWTAKAIEIDLKRLAALHMVTPDKPKSRVAEQFRVIKRPLIQNARGLGAAPVDDGNLIMVTSALPGEGKSFTAINLAISMAMELDFTVLLVDADFSKPSILSRLGAPPQRGLMDVLTGEIDDLSDVLVRTNIEKLTVLPAGISHPRATELIASEAMGAMLAEMSTRYRDRIVVFDSPPLIPTTEARVLATHMGQIVIVVEADRTSQGAIKAALATIETCPVKMMMLNKTAAPGESEFYGYGYGYGYGADAKSEAVG